MSKYIALAIRDFPRLLIGWRGAYIIGEFESIEEAIDKSEQEISGRGGKYGAVVFDRTGAQVWQSSK